MHTLTVRGQLKNAGVNVFGTATKKESLILRVGKGATRFAPAATGPTARRASRIFSADACTWVGRTFERRWSWR